MTHAAPAEVQTAIKIVIIDDHELVRRSLAEWLMREPDIDVVGMAEDADSGIETCVSCTPDVVLLDIDMPGRLSFDAARTIVTRVSKAKIVFLSGFMLDRHIEEALNLGAAGYLTKSERPEHVVAAIREVAAGGTAFSREVQDRMVVEGNGVRLKNGRGSRVSTLSPRELEVLRYIAGGMSKKEVAGVMHISVKTVDNHTTSLMAKLDLHDRVEVARFAIREGIVTA